MSGAGKQKGALSLAFCGLMAALGAAIMLVGGVLGVATYAAPLMASLCLLPMLTEYGRGMAWMGFAVTAALTALLCADKELAFFYVFLGYYPLLRAYFDRIRRPVPRILAKLAFFTVMTALMYAFLCFVLRTPELLEEFASARKLMRAAFFAAMILILLIYDLVLRLAETFYLVKLRPRIRFLR